MFARRYDNSKTNDKLGNSEKTTIINDQLVRIKTIISENSLSLETSESASNRDVVQASESIVDGK